MREKFVLACHLILGIAIGTAVMAWAAIDYFDGCRRDSEGRITVCYRVTQ